MGYSVTTTPVRDACFGRAARCGLVLASMVVVHQYRA
jgi:hypothetical protein